MVRRNLDLDDIHQRHLAGQSVKRMAQELGVDRGVINRRLRQLGITPRGRGEAMLLRWAQSTPEQREAMVAPAHQAATGRIHSEAERIKIANSREGMKYWAGPFVLALFDALMARGCQPVLEKALGPYNIDIGLQAGSVAVEIHGGGWHATGRHAARAGKRREYIFGCGWALIEIWPGKNTPQVPSDSLLDELVSISERRRLHDASSREHRVIGRDGKDLPILKSYGYNVASIHAAHGASREAG